MDECLFCKIAGGQVGVDFVYEDADCVAFRDINPQAPTHVLVIPRRHIPSPAELADLSGPDVFASAARCARNLGLKDYRLVANRGEEAGQSVFHLHVHILSGRRLGWPPG